MAISQTAKLVTNLVPSYAADGTVAAVVASWSRNIVDDVTGEVLATQGGSIPIALTSLTPTQAGQLKALVAKIAITINA